jgi:hypothetical protein
MHPPHRPTTLKPDEENVVIRLNEAWYANGCFVTQRDVLNFVEGELGKCFTYGWLHNHLVRHAIASVAQLYHHKRNPVFRFSNCL